MTALVIESPPAVRAVLFLDVAFLIFTAGSLGPSSWSAPATTVLVCLVPLGCLLARNRAPWLRPAAPWLRRRRADREMLALAAVTIVAAALALTVWTKLAHPEPAPYLRALHEVPLWLGLLGILGFALVNPIWEELLSAA